MSDKVLGLVTSKSKSDEEVVKMMEDWLSRAKSGRIQGAIIMGVADNGEVMRAKAGDMPDATTVYLATQVIHDGILAGREGEYIEPPPADTDEDAE